MPIPPEGCFGFRYGGIRFSGGTRLLRLDAIGRNCPRDEDRCCDGKQSMQSSHITFWGGLLNKISCSL